MIIDKIENQDIYKSLHKRFQKAFDFINNTDLAQLSAGKHSIDGENIFANVMEYETKNKREAKHEGHHKYIDLQYLISGEEAVGLRTLSNQVPVSSEPETDYDLYDIDSDFIRFERGTFMIFFPDDLHMPGITLHKISKVKKVIVKIKL